MKMFRKLFSVLLVVTMIASTALTVGASTVTYEGEAQKFVFTTDSEKPTDLFENFKDAMPGDVLEQEILVKNNGSKNVRVELSLKSEGADELSSKLLSQCKLTVTAESGDKTLFDAPASETAQLTEWKSLGVYSYGAEVKLNVKLEIPIEIGNEFQNPDDDIFNKIDWTFKAVEIPIETPKTGDTSNLGLWLTVVGVSAVAVAVVAVVAVKRKKKED